MENLVKALDLSIKSKNWYGSLFIALSVPDICGYLELPTKGSQERYEQWFSKYMLQKYSRCIGGSNTPHVFLSSSDCYALRCALLHEGREEITQQRARDALERFHFTEPSSRIVHLNQINQILQLQVDIFCSDMLSGLQRWLQDTKNDSNVNNGINSILKVYPHMQIPGKINIL
jgi:hypothetical protein